MATTDTPIIENAQTSAAIADSPFLQSFGDALKNAQNEASKKNSPDPVADPKPAEPSPAPVAKVETPVDKKPALPDFKKGDDAKQSEAASAEDIEVPSEIKSPKAAEQWKTLKREKIAMEKKAAELEAKLATANPNKIAEYEAKLKAIEAEKLDMSDRLKLLAIERHPEFTKKYDTKTSQVHTQLKAVAGAEGDKLVSLLSAPDSPVKAQEIDNIVAGMTPANQSRFGALIVKLEDINSERVAEIEATKSKFEEFRNGILDQQKNKTVESKARAEKIWSETAQEARAYDVLNHREGDAEWNASVDARLSTAKAIFSGEADETDLARASLYAVAAPELYNTNNLLLAKVAALQKELSGYKKSEPQLESGSKPAKTVGENFMSKVMKGV